jgi:Tol biopolymer transport system component
VPVLLVILALIGACGRGHRQETAARAEGRGFLLFDASLPSGAGLYRMQPDGGRVRRLSANGRDASSSSDGKLIAFSTISAAETAIFVMQPDGSGRRRLRLPSGVNTSPALAPNGRELAFLNSPDERRIRNDVWRMRIDGTGLRRLTRGADADDVAWAPSRTRVAYHQFAERGLGRIYALAAAGGKRVLVAKGDAPAWSPDGGRLAYSGAGESVWIVDVDGSGRRMVARHGRAPAWSPDGKHIAFVRATNCGGDVCDERIFIVSLTGGRARPVGPVLKETGGVVWVPSRPR